MLFPRYLITLVDQERKIDMDKLNKAKKMKTTFPQEVYVTKHIDKDDGAEYLYATDQLETAGNLEEPVDVAIYQLTDIKRVTAVMTVKVEEIK